MERMEQLLGRPLTAAQIQQFQAYAGLLRQWNPKINLVAPGTLASLEERHLLDCAQLAPHLPLNAGANILDVGSGAGLPGLVLAILAPQHRFTLAERDQRKAAFLHTAIFSLGLTNVKVHAADVTTLQNQYDVITSRAWADMKAILTLTSPLLTEQGAWLLLKGKALDVELEACETLFHLTIARTPSIVLSIDGEHGWIIKLSRVGVELAPSSTGNPPVA
ncbi:MAG: 16S rRNA (guanine(527)-N(7))-methyltransferase RsmG [Pseudomonas fluorescens]|nr:MAG: 16S rRNA (guanine(527)-N(7))-methyltransferase RsmG [Pseudomonas fluorescens]